MTPFRKLVLTTVALTGIALAAWTTGAGPKIQAYWATSSAPVARNVPPPTPFCRRWR
jgi:hypothetical protein